MLHALTLLALALGFAPLKDFRHDAQDDRGEPQETRDRFKGLPSKKDNQKKTRSARHEQKEECPPDPSPCLP
jgi:hypothetical protein